jgi:hypothetical protein
MIILIKSEGFRTVLNKDIGVSKVFVAPNVPYLKRSMRYPQHQFACRLKPLETSHSPVSCAPLLMMLTPKGFRRFKSSRLHP